MFLRFLECIDRKDTKPHLVTQDIWEIFSSKEGALWSFGS